MATRLGKMTALGLSVGMLGAACALIPFTSSVEEKFGLGWLFHLRGLRQPPTEVVVVTIDKQSADRLGLPNDPIKWPRSLHATLVDRLSEGGASVIVFDIYFREPRDLENDQQFTDAVRKAGNVVLFEYLKKEIIPVHVGSGEPTASLIRETRLPPIKTLKDAALAVAPFPLPNVPVTVSQFWLFKTDSGNIPTLPVLALQAHARDHLEEFLQLVRQEAGADRLVPALQQPGSQQDMPLTQLVKLLRSQFSVFPETAPALLRSIRKDRDQASISIHLLESLARVYTGPDSHYLNYYGPPRSIPTIPYYQVINPEYRNSSGNNLAFKGKTVFVGFSEQLQPEQRDGYYSVYSEASGLDISGVEIAATAFANLLENQPVRPLPFVWDIPLLLFWGLLLGSLLFYLSVPLALAASGFMAAGYLGFAYYLFQESATWLPVFIPLVIQAPVAIAVAIIWRNREVSRDHARTREAFGRFIPRHVVEKVSSDLSSISEAGELANGVCLATDAEQYTRLSEQLHPAELKIVLDEYYKAIGSPVSEYGGIISDVVGDALLAIWAAPESDVDLRTRACEAALQISMAAEKFRSTISNINLPTRIGLHAGEMFLGNVGAGEHFEYRAIGDIVNTANRIQGLNKQLGTRLLASGETLWGTAGLVNRELGSFMLAGKSRAVTIHELIGTSDVISPGIDRLCRIFGQALNDYRHRDWVDAAEKFTRLIEECDDGPAKFYLQQCQALIQQPPLEIWDATIEISNK